MDKNTENQITTGFAVTAGGYIVSTAVCAIIEEAVCKSVSPNILLDSAALAIATPVAGYALSYVGARTFGAVGALIDFMQHGKEALKFKPERNQKDGFLKELMPEYTDAKGKNIYHFRTNFTKAGATLGFGLGVAASLFYVPTTMNEYSPQI